MQTTRFGTKLAATIGLLLACMLALGATTAGAQTDPYVSDSGQTQGVLGNGDQISTLGNSGVQVLDSSVSRSGSGLPVTGGEAIALAVVGGGLVVVGGAAVLAGRRRHAAI